MIMIIWVKSCDNIAQYRSILRKSCLSCLVWQCIIRNQIRPVLAILTTGHQKSCLSFFCSWSREIMFIMATDYQKSCLTVTWSLETIFTLWLCCGRGAGYGDLKQHGWDASVRHTYATCTIPQCEFAYDSIWSKMQTTCSSACLTTPCDNLSICTYSVWCCPTTWKSCWYI